MERKEQTVLISIGANGLLISLRFLLAFVSGSLALKANAWHSLADVFVLGVVYIGLFVARQQDQRYAGIIAWMENIVAIFVSIFIFWMGFELFGEAVAGEAVELAYVVPSAIGAFLGVCITYFMGRYMLFVGHATGSPSLIAAGSHARMDMFCSTAVLLGLVGSIFGLVGLDKVAATIVVVFIFMAAIEIFMANVRALLSGRAELAHEHAHGLNKPGKLVTAGIAILIAAGYLGSGVYYVQPDEQAVVRRLGKILERPFGPGLHYRLPYPIDRANMVRTGTVREVGTRKRLLLSGDENLVEVDVSVHYRVSDPVKYLLKAAAPDTLVREAAQASVRNAVGHRRIDDLLTTGREDVLAEVRRTLQEELDRSDTGIEVVGVLLLELRPPEDVVDAFYDVASAREDKATYINEAHSARNALVPKARGEAAEKILAAEAYREQKVQYAAGEAGRFLSKLEEYAKARDITEVRLYLEAMEKVLPGVRKFLVDGDVETGETDLWFVGKDAGNLFGTK
ncbi:MAG: FtsH protease activity modulator HflK [Kiritimatiellaeota bacterium]|nr:FtsH protease activity modulator HflK [Kiritimatiellota bacterium]